MTWLLLACTSAEAVTWTGTLEPLWWATAPFGASPDDGTFAALVLRTDDGREAVYSPGDGDPTPDADAAACIGGRATVEGDLVQVDHPFAGSVPTKARVVSCEPNVTPAPAPFGPVTLTGRLERRWWYGGPGYGADPGTDKMLFGAAVFVNGALVHVVPKATEANRRVLVGCAGQEVTVRGELRAPKSAKASWPFVVAEAEFVAVCAAPALDRGTREGMKPDDGWMDGGGGAVNRVSGTLKTWMLVWLLGCDQPRDDLSRWEGCLFEGTRLAVDDATKAARPIPGDRDVLGIGVTWGHLPFVTDTEDGASLVVELAPDMPEGSALPLRGAHAEYREGVGMGSRRVANGLDGQVKVLERSGNAVKLEMEVLVPTSPGAQPLRLAGVTTVRRGRGPSCAGRD